MHKFRMKNPLKYTEKEEKEWHKLKGKHSKKHEMSESRSKERKEHSVY